MPQLPIAHFPPTILFKKIAVKFLLIFPLIFASEWIAYPLFISEKVDWSLLWTNAYLLAVLVTLVLQFRNIRRLITMIREGEVG